MRLIGSNRIVRDMLKMWQTEDFQAGAVEVVDLPSFNNLKRFFIQLDAVLTTTAQFVPANAPDYIFPIVNRVEMESSGEDRLINCTLSDLWFRSGIERGSYISCGPEIAASETTVHHYAMIQLDFSQMQDLAFNAGQVDKTRFTISWGAAACLGAQCTIVSANVKIWYDERIPGNIPYVFPHSCVSFFNQALATVTDQRIELPAGKRLTRLYLQLLDGACPIAFDNDNLLRFTLEYDGNVIYGPFNGLEHNYLWHLIHGIAPRGWAAELFPVGGIANIPLDLSWLVIDLVDPVNAQLSHAINTGMSDMFNLVYSFDDTGFTDARLKILYDYHYTALDRLSNDGSKLARIVNPQTRDTLKRVALISGNPIAVINPNVQLSSSNKMVRGVLRKGAPAILTAGGGSQETVAAGDTVVIGGRIVSGSVLD